MSHITAEHLDQAQQLDILTPPQTETLKQYLRKKVSDRQNYAQQDEPFTLFRGFSDIFLLIGLSILLIAFNGVAGAILLAISTEIGPIIWAGITIAATFWLSEYYVKKRGLLMISLLFVMNICAIIAITIASIIFDDFSFDAIDSISKTASYYLLLCSVASFIILGLYQYIYRTPYLPACLTINGVTIIQFLLTYIFVPSDSPDTFLIGHSLTLIDNLLSLIVSMACLIWAIKIDQQAPFRQNRESQTAFWFYLFAGFNFIIILYLPAELPGISLPFSQPVDYVLFFAMGVFLLCLSLWLNRRSLFLAYMASCITFCFIGMGQSLSVDDPETISGQDMVLDNLTSLSSAWTDLSTDFNILMLLIGLVMALIGSFWAQAHQASLAFVPNVLQKYLPKWQLHTSPDLLTTSFKANAEDIYHAVTSQILTAYQAQNLLWLSRHNSQDALFMQAKQGELFDFIKGYTDILITLGLCLFQIGFALSLLSLFDDNNWPHIWVLIILASLQIGLSAYYLRYRRLKLPGMSICLGLAATIFAIAFFEDWTQELIWIAPLLGLLFYIAFRLPFVLYLTALSGALLIFDLSDKGFETGPSLEISILYGCILVVIALYFDIRDRLRETRLAQNAFWLHLAAAPCLIHPFAFPLLIDDSLYASLGLFVAIIILSLFSIIIDRRSFLLSSSLYLLALLIKLLFFQDQTDMMTTSLFFIFFLIGVFLTSIGSFWEHIRKTIMSILPDFPGKDRLPPYQQA